MDNKKIVIYVGHFELPDKNALAHHVMANCFAMREAGYTPVLIGYNRDAETSDSILDTYRVINGFDCYDIKYPFSLSQWIKDMSNYKNIIKVVEKYKTAGVYAISCFGIGSRNMMGITEYSKKNGIFTVADVVDWFDSYSGNIIKKIYKISDDYIGAKFVKPNMKNAIVISKYLEKYYKSKGCNTVVVPSLTIENDKRFENLPEYIKEDTLSFIYCGRPSPEGSKDRIEWCIKAFHNVAPKNARLDLFGFTLEEYVGWFPQYKEEAMDERIVYHGLCSNRECVECIAKSDFSLLARDISRTTMAGFPSKYSETCALATPMITTPTSDLSDYIVNGENGYISKEATYESFEEIMKEVSSLSNDEIIAIHENCKKKKNTFDYSSYVTDFKEFLDNLQ